MLNKLRVSRPQWQIIRLGLSVGLILAVLYLVQAGLTLIAVLLVLASKWQIIRGGPRLWIHNFWDNIVDIIFVLSIIALLEVYSGTNISLLQLGIVGLYLAWQILIKPHAGILGHSIQALLTMVLAISVIFLMKSPIGIAGMIILAWIVAAGGRPNSMAAGALAGILPILGRKGIISPGDAGDCGHGVHIWYHIL
ncbi:hypothetical protein BRC19_03560 [Candidatus Saccharibacteria bacterium QS_5_54_17]|nr:MAG: hypothetical protein BRC19_03560 [Candidatus Saccharibacteria bacterium QS_5_54_17]